MKDKVSEILHLFHKHQDLMYGEVCTVLSHSFQSAEIAREQGHSDLVILAAVMHDIGHLSPLESGDDYDEMGGYGIDQHDLLGAHYLQHYEFPELVIACVRNHVIAKRYLCTVQPEYYETLSEASKETMNYQGGLLNEAEVASFEQDPFFKESVIIRKIDDLAKGEHFVVTEAHWQLVESLLVKFFG